MNQNSFLVSFTEWLNPVLCYWFLFQGKLCLLVSFKKIILEPANLILIFFLSIGAKVRQEIYDAFDNIYPILKSFKKQ